MRDPLLRGGAQQRDPQAAVGGEALLGGEVVGVDLRQVDRQPAGAGGRVDQHQRLAGARGPHDGSHDAGRGLVVRPPQRVHADLGRRRDAGRVRRVAGLGLDDQRLIEERRGADDLRELRGELAEREVQRAALDQPAGRGVPEGRRAAVAERYLVAGGRAEELGEAGADLADERLDGLLAVGGAHHRGAVLREVRERLRADLGGTAAEAPVGGLQLGRDRQLLLCAGAGRHGLPRFGLEVQLLWRCPGARRCCSASRSPVVASTSDLRQSRLRERV